jgi:hypothetical protein
MACKECPWVVRVSKRLDKPHNCHMKNGGKELWKINENTKCNGRKEYEKNRNTRGTQRETTENV